MKIPKRTVEDLLVLIQHARIDIGFREGGSYNHEKDGEWPFDEHSAKRAERAIEFIKQLIVQP